MLRRNSYITKWKLLSIAFVCIFLIVSDLTDLSEDDEAEQGTKIAMAVLVLIFGFFILAGMKVGSEQMSEQIYLERKGNKKALKKTLGTFSSKIVSHVKATPADFVKTLTNPAQYRNFKFEKIDDLTRDLNPPSQFDIKQQEENDKVFKDLSAMQGNDVTSPTDIILREQVKGDYVNRDNIKFTVLYDRFEERYLVSESTYELQKYWVLEYDDSRANHGVGNHLQVTQFTEVMVNVGTASIGRG